MHQQQREKIFAQDLEKSHFKSMQMTHSATFDTISNLKLYIFKKKEV